mmetsp:Transcript_36381/g.95550  ORF Transcript_36381/g.95550 Transcript_36381/m.95550 type:complete len:363 (+) Transcript_36381:52-1140(+)
MDVDTWGQAWDWSVDHPALAALAAMVGFDVAVKVVVQVLGRLPCCTCVFRLLGPVFFGAFIVQAMLLELAIVWPMLGTCRVLPRSAQKRVAAVARTIKAATWRVVLFLCPWIRLDVQNLELLDRLRPTQERPIMFLMNHTSFFDSVIATGVAMRVTDIAPIHRVLGASSLLKIPILGSIFLAEMHIPVHFKSSKPGTFGLDDETRKSMEADIQEAMEDKALFGLFPEGQLNRDDVTRLEPFRHGSFRVAIQHDAVIWGWVAAGNNIVWPPSASIGGLPAAVKCAPVELAPQGTLQCLREAGTPLEPRPGQTEEELRKEQCKALSEAMQAKMQVVLDGMFAELRQEGEELTGEGFQLLKNEEP